MYINWINFRYFLGEKKENKKNKKKSNKSNHRINLPKKQNYQNHFP